jgi:hypothetical protein
MLLLYVKIPSRYGFLDVGGILRQVIGLGQMAQKKGGIWPIWKFNRSPLTFLESHFIFYLWIETSLLVCVLTAKEDSSSP